MRLIICGGRNFSDHELFHTAITRWIELHGWPREIVAGGATGADAMARDWARENGVLYTEYAADWGSYGKRAGPLRNAAMAAHVVRGGDGGCLALPGGKGTADMVLQAKTNGLPVMAFF